MILIYAPHGHAGHAEHTFDQAAALLNAAAHVTFLVLPSFLDGGRAEVKGL